MFGSFIGRSPPAQWLCLPHGTGRRAWPFFLLLSSCVTIVSGRGCGLLSSVSLSPSAALSPQASALRFGCFSWPLKNACEVCRNAFWEPLCQGLVSRSYSTVKYDACAIDMRQKCCPSLHGRAQSTPMQPFSRWYSTIRLPITLLTYLYRFVCRLNC